MHGDPGPLRDRLHRKKAVVIGRSLVVGKTRGHDAVEEKRHSDDLSHADERHALCRERGGDCDRRGRPRRRGGRYVSFPGQIVIDVGINVNEEGKLCGDVDYEKAEPVVEAITPVPGGWAVSRHLSWSDMSWKQLCVKCTEILKSCRM